MLNYIFLFGVTTLLGFVADYLDKRGHSDPKSRLQKKWVMFILFLIYVVFVGCRAESVGSDTYAYVSKLDTASSMALIEYLQSGFFIEPIFNTYVWLCAHISSCHSFFFITSSFFFFSVFLKFVLKYSSSIGWSIWILNSMGFTIFALSTVRQTTAIAICLLSYMYMEKNYKKSWLLAIVAIGTHLSSAIYLPMMLVSKLNLHKIKSKMTIMLVCAVLIGPMLMGKLGAYYAVTTGKYESDSLTGEGVGGYGMIAFLIVLLVMSVKSYFPIKKDLPSTFYYEFIAIGLALAVFVISRVNIATIRLYWYYLAFSVVYIPNSFSLQKIQQRRICQYGVFIITIYYLSTNVLSSPYEESKLLLPYNFFWE